jgi:ABC-type lipoprotein release transport system permease subunit
MLAMAWRDLLRQGRRSLIAAVAVALVVFMAILVYAMGGAMKNSIYQDLTEAAGHVQIHAAGYRDAQAWEDGLMPDDGALTRSLAERAPDADIVRALVVPALVAGEERSRGVAIRAEDRSDRLERDFLDEHLADGRGLSADATDEVLLGASLAEALGLALGDPVYVYAPGGEGFGAAAYELVGLLSFDDPSREITEVETTLPAAQELAAPGRVSYVGVHLPAVLTVASDPNTEALAAAIADDLGPAYAVEHWRELDPGLVAMIDFLMPIMVVYSAIFFVLAGLLVLNTIYLSTLERVREFGVVLALGAQGGDVVRIVTIESLIVCLGGAVVGLAAGLGLVAVLSDGFTFPGMESLMAEVGMNPVMYPTLEPWQIALAVAFAILTGVAAAAGPARMAARIAPAEAMRHTV